MTPVAIAAPEAAEVGITALALSGDRPDLGLLAFPLVSVDPEEILEHEITPAIADALPVDFLYDHPERGVEQRRIVPTDTFENARGQLLVLGYDQDRDGAVRNFRVDRIRAARLEG